MSFLPAIPWASPTVVLLVSSIFPALWRGVSSFLPAIPWASPTMVVVVDVGVEVGGARWAGHLPPRAASGPRSRQQSWEPGSQKYDNFHPCRRAPLLQPKTAALGQQFFECLLLVTPLASTCLRPCLSTCLEQISQNRSNECEWSKNPNITIIVTSMSLYLTRIELTCITRYGKGCLEFYENKHCNASILYYLTISPLVLP